MGQVEPLKTSGFRLTIETNRPPLPLGGLFEDMVVDAASAAAEGAALSIVYGCGLDATVLASKKERGRYRVCSSRFEGLWLLSDELVRFPPHHRPGLQQLLPFPCLNLPPTSTSNHHPHRPRTSAHRDALVATSIELHCRNKGTSIPHGFPKGRLR